MNIRDNEPDEFEWSGCMGPILRRFVEGQLLLDLNMYAPASFNFNLDNVRFDWSNSCIEGHRMDWLDGEIENFSGVAMFDHEERLIAEGWMEFIKTETDVEVFWWLLSGGEYHAIQDKSTCQVPAHIWNRLSDDLRLAWRQYAPIAKKLP